MSQKTQEKRRFPRKTLETTAAVLDNDTGQPIGILADVSKGGFSIITDLKFRPCEDRSVTLLLPGPKDSAHRVSLTAQCVWCQTIRGRFAAGFILRRINDQDEVALNYYIRDYQLAGEPQEA